MFLEICNLALISAVMHLIDEDERIGAASITASSLDPLPAPRWPAGRFVIMLTATRPPPLAAILLS